MCDLPVTVVTGTSYWFSGVQDGALRESQQGRRRCELAVCHLKDDLGWRLTHTPIIKSFSSLLCLRWLKPRQDRQIGLQGPPQPVTCVMQHPPCGPSCYKQTPSPCRQRAAPARREHSRQSQTLTNTVSPSVFSSVERDLSHVSFVLVTFPPVPSPGLLFCSHVKISAPFTFEPLTVSPTTLLHAAVSRHPGYILPPALRDCDVHLVYGFPVLTPHLSCQLLPSPCGSPFLPQIFLVLDFSPFLPICFLAPTHTSFPEFLIPKLVERSLSRFIRTRILS